MKASQVWIKTLYRSNGGIEEVMNRSDRESIEGVWKAQKIGKKEAIKLSECQWENCNYKLATIYYYLVSTVYMP